MPKLGLEHRAKVVLPELLEIAPNFVAFLRFSSYLLLQASAKKKFDQRYY
jgi:hypothetical protein